MLSGYSDWGIKVLLDGNASNFNEPLFNVDLIMLIVPSCDFYTLYFIPFRVRFLFDFKQWH